ncbi:DNA polymerase-3 subunit beta [Xylanibacter ruminicola]|jgi:DNA polymerase-3 subunit beta|uniref:Beta sliding clamp n=1 Tax=Xylanibacter ruminicola TaxID=839 RepID=A0A1H5VUW0_XYLRU|nr:MULTISPECIES: DNA polymerase III subunit beta [Prevotellaceae]MCR5470883.1 DNA polymerase III subunit beta [Prevotella sp.]SEF91085.1 DNA polymerase-3 subunit beta [Xylanibacter ruminicola]SEV81881.1 DNA polymerase-3 subunit beta [Prevotella sp. khp7]
MRFTLSSTALSTKLAALSKVINSKNALPILGDFVFEINDNVLYLTASDSENLMKTQMPLTESDSNGRFAIGNHDLLEAVKGFSEQPITFDVNQEQNTVKISYQNGMFSLPIENADEFPMPQPISDYANTITIPNAILAENINRSIFATAQDELRPVMNGIYFDLTTDCLAVVASDGHKLVRNKIFTIKGEQPAAFILPKKPAGLLKNLLGKDGGDVVIRFDERNAEISYGDGIIQCRLIEGRYPNYNSVIPQANPNELRVDRLSLLAALRRVQPFANDSSNLIRFHVEGTTLQLDAEDYDFSKTATERMTCEYNGQPMSIGFKGASFIEVLNNFDCAEVIIQLADPSRAGLVIPSEQPENQDVLMLMMPMLIND